MELTREEAVSRHRKMWRWIAEETEKRKNLVLMQEYFKVMGIEEEDIPANFCYCCEYAKNNCNLCPILWDRAVYDCCKGNIYYHAWLSTYDWELSAEVARLIAELPERKVV